MGRVTMAAYPLMWCMFLSLLSASAGAMELEELKSEVNFRLDTISSMIHADTVVDPDLKISIKRRLDKLRDHIHSTQSDTDQMAQSFLELKRSVSIYRTELMGHELAAKYPEYGLSVAPVGHDMPKHTVEDSA